MKMNKKKICFRILWCGVVIAALPLLFLGVYTAWYEYTFYKEYKSAKSVRLLHVYNRKYKHFEIELPVKFVPESHDAGVVQKLLVTAENRKSFMIFLYEDNHIQLLSMTIKKYPLIGIVTMYYDLTDAKSKEKLRKLLDAHREPDE